MHTLDYCDLFSTCLNIEIKSRLSLLHNPKVTFFGETAIENYQLLF